MTHPPVSTLIPRGLYEGRRIGLFGGSFNPPHAGHLAVAEEALKRLRLDEVWWLVATRNPLKSADDTADLEKRLRQTRGLAAHPRFRVLDLERGAGTLYTADLLGALGPVLKGGLFVWIMGADSFATLHRWGRWRNIVNTLPLAVFDRPGWGLKALHSPAALAFRFERLPQEAAMFLPELEAPAWSFLTMPLRAESSTCLRHPEKC
jgi:nicotinate-nucleotide adenylyltransferase